jgi:hypothetical protein
MTGPFSLFLNVSRERMEYATHDGITVGSNTESAADLQTMLTATDTPVDPKADEKPAETPTEDATAEPVKADDAERNTDGTFKAKKPNAIQDRIDKAVAKQRDAERRAEEAERRAREYEARLTPKPEPAKAEPAKADPEPTPDQFDTYEKYVKAQAKWEARQEITATLAEQRKAYEAAQERQAAEARGKAWQERLAATRKAIPDFDARINANTVVSAPMKDLITDSPVGPEILLYLSDHPDDAQRLSTLHPIQVIREMGKLEARLEAAHSGPAKETPKASAAKPPIKPVGSSPQIADDDGSDDEDVDAHIARENARDRKAARR